MVLLIPTVLYNCDTNTVHYYKLLYNKISLIYSNTNTVYYYKLLYNKLSLIDNGIIPKFTNVNL